MTARERQASGGVSLAARPTATPPRAGSTSPTGERDLPLWEELFRCLPPTGQEELLSLAARQGLLHAHQIPPVDPSLLQQRRQLLTNLLAGKVRDLPPISPTLVSVLDESLDAGQREAIARALATPDVCLIQGPAGSGKSRTAAEIVAQAALRGERVLLVSAGPAGLDRVLEQAGRRDCLWPIRLLQPGETAETLPACIRPFTIEERSRALQETAVQSARSGADTARQRLERRRAESATWDRLAEVAARMATAESGWAALESRRAALADDVQREWASPVADDAFARAATECLQRHTQEKERIATERDQLKRQDEADRCVRATIAEELAAIRPAAEAKRQGRWWTLTGLLAMFKGDLLTREEELVRQLAEFDTRHAALTEQIRQLDEADQTAEKEFERRRQELIEQETERRSQERQRESHALAAERSALSAEWDNLLRSLGEGSPRPADANPTAVAQARAEWDRLLQRDEHEADFARRWADTLAEAAPTLAGRLLDCANLVAATPASIAEATGSFDLLVVEEAELIAEPDLAQAARRARRWVLIGEPDAPPPVRPTRGPSVLRAGPFSRLWQSLHASPRQLPFRWYRADGRLCCRLRAVPDDQRNWIQSEPVADRREIELLILAAPRQEPLLVEVRFPADTPPQQAKTFILGELQEVPAHARGPAYLWTQDADGFHVQMGDVPADAWTSREQVTLENGLIEVVHAGDEMAVETLGFSFRSSAGWTRPRAEAWLSAHLGVRDPGRTAYLHRLHRPRGRLASFLAGVLFRVNGATAAPDEVRFTAVPSIEDSRRRGRDTRRGGAGFEADLNNPATCERLPGDMKALLPRQGLVNHPEAVAIVQALEALVGDPGFQSEAAAWQQGRLAAGCGRIDSAGCQNHGAAHAPAVVVTALYDAQVRLLRHLIQRSPVLARAGLTALKDGHFRLGDALEVVVASPPALRQRECLALLLSLTRSHSHRAVAMGEHASWLPLALTRPCGRLMLFGDPGTLVRRTQWQGAVDHLDETAGERERDLIAGLLHRLPEAEHWLCAPAADSARR